MQAKTNPFTLGADYALCICTYKRPLLLLKLLQDVAAQTHSPEAVIIVDGDPASQGVANLLATMDLSVAWRLWYLPSNHANLSYQRYLGYKAARNLNAEVLLYLDDDLRISQPDALEKVLFPLSWDKEEIFGVTATFQMVGYSQQTGTATLWDRQQYNNGGIPLLVRLFGNARKIPPGGLSPAGQRRLPLDQGQDYAPVDWLRGGVMAYSMRALSEDCFSEDLFAMYQLRCGKGEDTFLSRKVRSKGQLLLAFCAQVEHPDDDLPKSYPYQAYRFGYASAYSRRLLNDHYRGFDPPLWKDRFALFKSYLGTTGLNWWRAISGPKKHRFAFAWGYTRGAIRGLVQKPTARNLTPKIDWFRDAEDALHNMIVIQNGRSI
ncbi:MAG: glycosyltransferase [Desulfobacca sp.]|nr:glycosyltransferase [Desulfobacca sp.]